MLLTALLFNTLTGVVCASVLGFSPVAGAVGMNAVAAFMGMAPQSTSILREGVYTEIWTGELVKVLRAGLEGTWLSGIPDQSSIVNNDVIHLVEVGVDPDVLINNKTYPIDVQALETRILPSSWTNSRPRLRRLQTMSFMPSAMTRPPV